MSKVYPLILNASTKDSFKCKKEGQEDILEEITMKKPIVILLTLLCLGSLSTIQAAADGLKKPESSAPTNLIDDTHKTVSDTILLFTNRVDSFFGTQRGDEEANGSKLRVYVDHNFREYDNDQSRVDLRFTLKLPQLEKLFKFKFEKKDPQHSPSVKKEESQTIPLDKEEEKSLLDIPRNLFRKWNYGISTGVKVAIPPNPYIRSRLRRTFAFSKFEFNPTQELNWFLEEGLGYNMSNDLDYQVSDWGLLRITNSLNWTDQQDEVFTTHGPNFFLGLSDKSAIQFYLLAFARNKPKYYVHQYSFGASYRKKIYSNWVYLSINPSITWPETRQWARVLALNLRLEAVFGSL